MVRVRNSGGAESVEKLGPHNARMDFGASIWGSMTPCGAVVADDEVLAGCARRGLLGWRRPPDAPL